ncbi:tRNA pseudouridine(13) synthase TruD [Pseudidiomarina sediminum]|uniref:tRNA pseudouridine(13) synthase TruD n=1 Tax=Pseudidiomarina sediminum TaxID=431675 RepID=UPI001C950E7F|nr:tRNA pseudouridine(13) synthase TruD [Pseudidiomarina sediminum]MBY6063173.1 tRNA pseudouridine(13) synthase TruD [Pseudidiomarina sediminum]
MSDSLTTLAYLHGAPQVNAQFRATNSDFQVVEQLDVEDEGAGEHQWLWVAKSGANTTFVARQLAEFAGVDERQVSYAGLKDRHAETWQWFSVQLPGQQLLAWHDLKHPEFRVERALLRSKKLKLGYHQGNAFRLRLRDVDDVPALHQRWQQIIEQGVPNYFGEQRFGHDGQNLTKARAWLTGELSRKQVKRWSRQQQGLLLSSVRSALFNQIVSARIAAQRLQPEADDFLLLQGTRSFFRVEALDDALAQRFASGDVQLSAPLAGSWREPWQDHLSPFEYEQLQQEAELLAGLQRQRVDLARRALLLLPQDTAWHEVDATTIELSFRLPRGSFATSVLRELIQPLTKQGEAL